LSSGEGALFTVASMLIPKSLPVRKFRSVVFCRKKQRKIELKSINIFSKITRKTKNKIAVHSLV